MPRQPCATTSHTTAVDAAYALYAGAKRSASRPGIATSAAAAYDSAGRWRHKATLWATTVQAFGYCMAETASDACGTSLTGLPCVQVRDSPGAEWRTVKLSSAIKALVVLNLQACLLLCAYMICQLRCSEHAAVSYTADEHWIHICQRFKLAGHGVRWQVLDCKSCLQSYAGGRDLWGLADTANDERRGWRTPIFNDGLFEACLPSGACCG